MASSAKTAQTGAASILVVSAEKGWASWPYNPIRNDIVIFQSWFFPSFLALMTEACISTSMGSRSKRKSVPYELRSCDRG
jgi:hypothetical protein